MLADDAKEKVMKLLLFGKRIDAIKFIAETYRVNLKNAITLVDAVDREMNPGKKISRPWVHGTGIPGIFFWVFGGIGALLTGIAVYLFVADRSAIQHYTVVHGIVTTNRYNHDGMASPTISYQWHGKEKVYYSNTWSHPAAFNAGEAVQLYVNPDDPEEMFVDSFVERFLVILILGGIGSVFLAFTLLFYFLSRGGKF